MLERCADQNQAEDEEDEEYGSGPAEESADATEEESKAEESVPMVRSGLEAPRVN